MFALVYDAPGVPEAPRGGRTSHECVAISPARLVRFGSPASGVTRVARCIAGLSPSRPRRRGRQPGRRCAMVPATGGPRGSSRTGSSLRASGFTVIKSSRRLAVVAAAASLRCDRSSACAGRGGTSIERGVGMVPCSSKVKFGAALVVVGFALAVGLATGATPALASTPCTPGSYSSTGSQPCTPAPPGSFVATIGAISATPCPAGTYQPSSGQTSCLNAPPGSFVASTGATSATPCALGTYQPNTGQASCLLAPIGSYVSTTGATSATACPTGTTTTTTGSTSITDCHTPTPITADQCKHGGWRHLADKNGTPFKNQGDCVSYVATGGRNLADGPPQTSSTTPSASPIAGSPPAAPPAPSTKAKRRKSSRHHHHGRHGRKAARRVHGHR